MRGRSRNVLLAMIIALTTLSVGLQLFPEAGCVDGCDEGGGAACADCPMCSPARPAELGPPQIGPIAEPVGDYEAPPSIHRSRAEDRGVFHVPKHLV